MLSVDKTHFIMWLEGTLLHFENGKGICINEVECDQAEQALLRGEKVLLRNGSDLTGLYIVLDGDNIVENKINLT